MFLNHHVKMCYAELNMSAELFILYVLGHLNIYPSIEIILFVTVTAEFSCMTLT